MSLSGHLDPVRSGDVVDWLQHPATLALSPAVPSGWTYPEVRPLGPRCPLSGLHDGTWTASTVAVADRLRAGLLELRQCRREGLVLLVLGLVSWIGTLGAPLLLPRPLALMAMAPRVPFLVLAGRHVPLLPFIAIGVARLLVAHPAHYSIGARVGGAACPNRGRRRRATRPALLGLVFVRPIGRHVAAAAAAGIDRRTVLCVDAAGLVAYLFVLHEVGRAFF